MKVLLAIDGSEPAARAAQLVGQLAWPDGSSIRVLAVVQPMFDPAVGMPEPAISSDVLDELTADVLAEAERVTAAAAFTLEAEGRLVESVVAEGRPATSIIDNARDFGADLVVVGSYGRGALAATVLGSVSAEVAESAPCSVLVARSPTISRLILADDRSEHSAAARRLVAIMPGFRGLQVRVVTVEERAPGWYGWLTPESSAEVQDIEDAWAQDRRELAAFVEREAKELNDAGLVATAAVRNGDPGAEIVASAREAHADLVVMGSRGRSRLASILIGSVSRKVLSHAPCSVLIVRRRVTA